MYWLYVMWAHDDVDGTTITLVNLKRKKRENRCYKKKNKSL